MTPDPISADLKAVLRRLKLSRGLDTLPERLTLARQQKLPHQDFCSSSSATRSRAATGSPPPCGPSARASIPAPSSSTGTPPPR